MLTYSSIGAGCATSTHPHRKQMTLSPSETCTSRSQRRRIHNTPRVGTCWIFEQPVHDEHYQHLVVTEETGVATVTAVTARVGAGPRQRRSSGTWGRQLSSVQPTLALSPGPRIAGAGGPASGQSRRVDL